MEEKEDGTYRGSFKGIVKKAIIKGKVPNFMCLIQNLSKQKQLTPVDLVSKITRKEIELSNEEIQQAGMTCIEMGKFRTTRELKKVMKGGKEKRVSVIRFGSVMGGILERSYAFEDTEEGIKQFKENIRSYIKEAKSSSKFYGKEPTFPPSVMSIMPVSGKEGNKMMDIIHEISVENMMQ